MCNNIDMAKDPEKFFKEKGKRFEQKLKEDLGLSEANRMVQYKKMLIDLISGAETEEQRNALRFLLMIFKNRFKKEPGLIHQFLDLEQAIDKFNSSFF